MENQDSYSDGAMGCGGAPPSLPLREQVARGFLGESPWGALSRPGRAQNARSAPVAVGTRVTPGPPHRSRRAGLPHRAPALGDDGQSGHPDRDGGLGVQAASA